MSLFIKKRWSKTAKIAGAIFFAALMFVNVKLTTDPSANGDIDLFGLKLSLFTPSAYASGATGKNWKVTCEYDGQGNLVKKVCESTSNNWCSCD